MIDDQWLEAANCVIKRMREQLDTARTASAAWKASAKKQKQRVAELEEALQQAYPFMACECDDEYECTGCGISEARSKVLSAFNK